MRSFSVNGTYQDVTDDTREIVTNTTQDTETNRGRRVLLSLLDSVASAAKPGDTVNGSYNLAVGPNGRADITATLSLIPAPGPWTPPKPDPTPAP